APPKLECSSNRTLRLILARFLPQNAHSGWSRTLRNARAKRGLRLTKFPLKKAVKAPVTNALSKVNSGARNELTVAQSKVGTRGSSKGARIEQFGARRGYQNLARGLTNNLVNGARSFGIELTRDVVEEQQG